jgi:hypothetical protein
MRLRIRRRHDYSWPVGWLALALEVAAVPTAVVTNSCNDTCVSDYFLGTFWLGGFIAILIALLLTVITAPPGKGWAPAVCGFLFMFITVLVLTSNPSYGV